MKILKHVIFPLLVTTVAVQTRTFSQICQDYREVVNLVEQYSPALQAARLEMLSEIKGNHTDLTPANPEVTYSGLFSNETGHRYRNDFEISQSFDFPSVYVYKSRMAKMADSASFYAFQAQRAEVLMEARLICMEIIYINALVNHAFNQQIDAAQNLAAKADALLESGQSSIIERNKAHLNLIDMDKRQVELLTRKAELVAQLKRYTGGADIDLQQDLFPDFPLPADFNDFYAEVLTRNPLLKRAHSESLALENNRRAAAGSSLPSFSVGYIGEDVTFDGGFHGFSVGLSLPLWENKNKVKQAKISARAARIREQDAEFQLRSDMESLYRNVTERYPMVLEYREKIDRFNTLPYLEKALESGEISFLIYIDELQYLFDMVEKYLQSELELAQAYTRLMFLSGME